MAAADQATRFEKGTILALLPSDKLFFAGVVLRPYNASVIPVNFRSDTDELFAADWNIIFLMLPAFIRLSH
jgi:hypothetical protein